MHTSMVMGGRRTAGGPCLRRPEAEAEAEAEDSDEEADTASLAAWEGSSSPEKRSGAVGLEEDSEAERGTSMSSRTR